jgi:hypothetical protein
MSSLRSYRQSIAALAVLAWLSTCACQVRDERETGQASPAASAVSSSASSRFPRGKTASYELELATLSDTGQSPLAVQLTLLAKVDATFRADGAATRVEVTMRDARLVDHTKRPASGADELAGELQRSFGFEIDGTGDLTPIA